MVELKNIFPECDADTLLVELITQRGHPNHCKGISKVSTALKNNSESNGFFIGIVDSDKFKRIVDDKYLQNFTEELYNFKEQDEGIVLKRIPNKHHYILFIHKEFEPWVWKQAKLAQINTEEYGFSDLKSLYRESKHYRTNESQKFKKFVNAVVKANPPGVQFLKKWLIIEN